MTALDRYRAAVELAAAGDNIRLTAWAHRQTNADRHRLQDAEQRWNQLKARTA